MSSREDVFWFVQLQVRFLPLKHLCGSGPETDVWPGHQRMSLAHLSIPDTGGSRTDHTGCRRRDRPLSWEQRYRSLMIAKIIKTATRQKKVKKYLRNSFSNPLIIPSTNNNIVVEGVRLPVVCTFISWSLSKLS